MIFEWHMLFVHLCCGSGSNALMGATFERIWTLNLSLSKDSKDPSLTLEHVFLYIDRFRHTGIPVYPYASRMKNPIPNEKYVHQISRKLWFNTTLVGENMQGGNETNKDLKINKRLKQLVL